MSPLFKRKFIVLVAVAAVLLLPLAAQADTTYQLIHPNTALTPYPSPYADILVQLTSSTTAKITYTALSTGGFDYLLGAQGAMAVNVNATAWSIGTFSASNKYNGFTPGPLSDGGSIGDATWGKFNQYVDSFDGLFHTFTTGSFVLTNTSGTWANSDLVLTNISTENPYLAAGHVFVATFDEDGNLTSIDPNTNQLGALATGYASNGPPSGGLVPVPPTAWLLGSGLVGLLLLGRRRKTG